MLKQNLINQFLKKEEVYIETAIQFLEDSQYNLGLAFNKYEEEKYGKTGLILRKNKDKEKALDKILYLIETEYSRTRHYMWVQEESMQQLDSSLHVFIRLMD